MPDFTLTWHDSQLYLTPLTVGACLWLIDQHPSKWSPAGSVVLSDSDLNLLDALESAGLKAA